MLRAIKYEIRPTKVQAQAIQKACGCSRFVYNKALALKIERYQQDKVNLSQYDLDKLLTSWKKEFTFLSDCPSQALQQKVHDMCGAFGKMKNGAKFPKFKRKSRCKESFRVPTSLNINYDDWTCKIAKIGKVKVLKGHNKQVSNVHSYTVEFKASLDRYFVSVLYEDNSLINKRIPNKDIHCGIDVGIKTFATLSDGKVFENQKYLKSNLKQLKVLQRSASRKYRKGVKTEDQSRNWKKVQKRIAKLHFHIANQRNDYNHKVSKYIAENYYLVSVEDLAVKNMVKNHRLAQAVSDVAWRSFLSMLKYKCQAYQEVDRFFASSQTCGCCGYKDPKVKDLSVRFWVCPQCGAKHDRDLNASQNIDREGLSLWRHKVSQ